MMYDNSYNPYYANYFRSNYNLYYPYQNGNAYNNYKYIVNNNAIPTQEVPSNSINLNNNTTFENENTTLENLSLGSNEIVNNLNQHITSENVRDTDETKFNKTTITTRSDNNQNEQKSQNDTDTKSRELCFGPIKICGNQIKLFSITLELDTIIILGLIVFLIFENSCDITLLIILGLLFLT